MAENEVEITLSESQKALLDRLRDLDPNYNENTPDSSVVDQALRSYNRKLLEGKQQKETGAEGREIELGETIELRGKVVHDLRELQQLAPGRKSADALIRRLVRFYLCEKEEDLTSGEGSEAWEYYGR